jgi:AraC-like DNA-binding protein
MAYAEGELGVLRASARQSPEWVAQVIELLDSAIGQLQEREPAAHCAVLQATSLLKRHIDPKPTPRIPDARGQLLAWQVRKVREYIDRNMTNRLLVADLCVLVQRSEAHFARSFRLTFGESPHAFVVRRRLQLAARYMLRTEMDLSEIALCCGFSDQAHLCRRFRDAMGQSPAAWRRVSRTSSDGETRAVMPPGGLS